MKTAITFLLVSAMTCYAAPATQMFWPYLASGPATFQERNYLRQRSPCLQGCRDYGRIQPETSLSAMDPYDYTTGETIPAAMRIPNVTQNISVDPMTSGAVEAVYQSPNKGRVSIYLYNIRSDILIAIDARFNWRGETNKLVLNSKFADKPWDVSTEVYPKGFPFPCCGYVTTITLRVELDDSDFTISANGIEIAVYPYRDGLYPPVTKIQYIFEDENAPIKAKLESLAIHY